MKSTFLVAAFDIDIGESFAFNPTWVNVKVLDPVREAGVGRGQPKAEMVLPKVSAYRAAAIGEQVLRAR